MAGRTATDGSRMSADERRRLVLAAAVAEFAVGGLQGTSTEAIARRAGISQPYLFRLFPSKKDLFIAAVQDTFARTETHFERAAGERTGADALSAIGDAYQDLLADRTYLLMQMQAYAGSADPVVRAATQAGFRDLWAMVERVTGLEGEEIVHFFAMGMLLNVAAALDLRSLKEEWATKICGPMPVAPSGSSPSLPGGAAD